jgi:hypothetical protein
MCESLGTLFAAFNFLIMSQDGIELMIMIIATFGQAISGSGGVISIIGALVCWRFIVSAFLTNV